MKQQIIILLSIVFLAVTGMQGAGRLYDRVNVTLPYTVEIQGKLLPPGDYTIEEFRGASDSNILHVFGEKGMDLKATVHTIDALSRNAAGKTEVVLQRIGNDYFFDKIWIEGKNYGYQFTLPADAKARERELRSSVSSVLVPAVYAAKFAKPEDDETRSRVGAANDRGRDWLTREIRHELIMLPYYGVFDHFTYRIDGDTVTLLGQVTRPTLKSSAENVVKRIEGVERVNNEIEVLPLSAQDDRIRVAAYRAIYGHTALNRYSLRAVPPIHIIVNNGDITLEGVVANQADKNIAGIQANGVSGAFSVTNNLRTDSGPEPPSENPAAR
ncbi:MAG: BON domain-containing protein [Bryobacteraceae bacterium]